MGAVHSLTELSVSAEFPGKSSLSLGVIASKTLAAETLAKPRLQTVVKGRSLRVSVDPSG